MHTGSPQCEVDTASPLAAERERSLCPVVESDRRFQELIEDAPDAIVQVDAHGLIVLANRTAVQMFGYSRQELLGSNVDLLMPAENRAAHAKRGYWPAWRSGIILEALEQPRWNHTRRPSGAQFIIRGGYRGSDFVIRPAG